MSSNPLDMTLPPDLRKRRGTGATLFRVPIYADTIPPCNHACPAGENIQGWLALAQEGRFEEAFQLLVQDNPMPAIHGRVCYHPCETSCNRGDVDDTVSIHGVERFLGDEAIKKGWKVRCDAKPTGKRVLVIGSGPCGLSAAYHLRRRGHEVEIRESQPILGGMMNLGIPDYRLPKDILKAEIDRVEEIGVKISTNCEVTDLLEAKESGHFDAVFLAIGAHVGRDVDIPNDDPHKVVDAITYLRDISLGKKQQLGKKIIVYGGGNTAMDAARTARRLGSEVTVVYRRDRAHMPAHDFECAEAIEEGVNFHWLRTINSIDKRVFNLEKTALNSEGRPEATGEFETIEADSIILALGQNVDTKLTKDIPGVEQKWDGTVVVDSNMMTGYRGLFAGGDMIPSDRTVTISVGHGKKAAKNIDAFFLGKNFQKPTTDPKVDCDLLHLWYKTRADQRQESSISLNRRVGSFDEIVAGFTEEETIREAQRCYSCGNCFECDGCFGACPQDAITRLGPGKGYEVDYEKCNGCGACYLQCPCHAIEMVSAENV